MWEEVARYEAARRDFVGQTDGSNADSGCKSGCSTGGHEAAKSSLHDLEAAEGVLLRGLDSDSGDSRGGRCPQGQNGARPDPRFLEWRELVLSEHQLASEREVGSRDDGGRGTAGDVDPRVGEDAEAVLAGREESWDAVSVGVDRLDEVTRLQQSLLMLLDEVEGRRELLAHEFEQRKRRAATATRGGSDGRRTEVDVDDGRAGRGGMDRALREFEVWYCWNKVRCFGSGALLRKSSDGSRAHAFVT